MNNSFFQIYALIFVSLGQIMYLIHVKPFEEPKFNYLEIFNEIVILVCCYHLLFFIDANIDTQMKYLAGWSLDLMIILQFFINIFIYFL